MVTWEDECHHSKCVSPPFLQLLLLSTMPHGMEYPFCHLGSGVVAVSPPNSLGTPSPLAAGVGQEAEEALTLYKHCSAITKTSLY